MAWAIELTVTNLAEKRIRVVATRTDGEDVRSYAFNTQIDGDDLPGSKASILDTVKRLRTEDVAESEAHADLLNSWSDILSTDLDAWEAE